MCFFICFNCFKTKSKTKTNKPNYAELHPCYRRRLCVAAAYAFSDRVDTWWCVDRTDKTVLARDRIRTFYAVAVSHGLDRIYDTDRMCAFQHSDHNSYHHTIVVTLKR